MFLLQSSCKLLVRRPNRARWLVAARKSRLQVLTWLLPHIRTAWLQGLQGPHRHALPRAASSPSTPSAAAAAHLDGREAFGHLAQLGCHVANTAAQVAQLGLDAAKLAAQVGQLGRDAAKLAVEVLSRVLTPPSWPLTLASSVLISPSSVLSTSEICREGRQDGWSGFV